MCNKEVKLKVKESGLKLWQVASQVGIADTTLSRWLRMPLKGNREVRVKEAIEKLVATKEGA